MDTTTYKQYCEQKGLKWAAEQQTPADTAIIYLAPDNATVVLSFDKDSLGNNQHSANYSFRSRTQYVNFEKQIKVAGFKLKDFSMPNGNDYYVFWEKYNKDLYWIKLTDMYFRSGRTYLLTVSKNENY